MKLLVGLGNPGAQYAGNRHNIGFMLLDNLQDDYRGTPWRHQFHGLLSEAFIGVEKTLLLKPQTYMNRSGVSVGECARFYKIPPEEVVVFHDELDIDPARIKIKQGGGHGGHNGLKDIDRTLGQNYWRVRLGIGHPGDKHKVSGYVLQDFRKEEWPDIEDMLRLCVRHVPMLIQQSPAAYRDTLSQEQARVK